MGEGGDPNVTGTMGGLRSTRDLVVEAVGGDIRARGKLLERLRPRLTLWAAARLSPKLREYVDAEDVVQEVLLAVHEGFEGFRDRGEKAFFGWLFTLAENRIRDLADYAGARKRQAGPVMMTISETTPATAAIRSETLDRLRAAVARLPEDYRQVLLLRRFEERETTEVALLMGRSENAVRILYCRAIKELRQALAEGDSSA